MKIRTAAFVIAFAAISAWASAQNGPTTAGEHLTLLKGNRKLLEELLDEGVRLGDSNTNLDRAAQCQSVAARLTRELKNAVDVDDADRVAEMTDHFSTLIQAGFLPNLSSAKESIPVGSPEYARLVTIHSNAAKNLDAVTLLIPAEGALIKKKGMTDARAKLQAAAAAVGKPVPVPAPAAAVGEPEVQK